MNSKVTSGTPIIAVRPNAVTPEPAPGAAELVTADTEVSDAAKGAHIKAADAKVWHEWLTGPAGRAAVSSFKIGGEQLFFPLPAEKTN